MKTALKYIIPLVLIPITVILGACIFSEKSYSFVSMAVAIFSCLLFYFAYERKGKTRRLIIVSVMTAIAVIGDLSLHQFRLSSLLLLLLYLLLYILAVRRDF